MHVGLEQCVIQKVWFRQMGVQKPNEYAAHGSVLGRGGPLSISLARCYSHILEQNSW